MKQYKNLIASILLGIGITFSAALAAETDAENPGPIMAPSALPEELTPEQGLKAWDKIFSVVSHPRCVNCHVGENNIPMWSGPSFGEQPRIHGMNINAGESRIGAEGLICSACHEKSAQPNTIDHAPPHTNHDWLLAPVEFTWFGKKSDEICQQMRDPERNGGRDGAGLVEHIIHDVEIQAFIAWSFDPGGERQAPPGTLQEHLDDMAMWTAAGMPCSTD